MTQDINNIIFVTDEEYGALAEYKGGILYLVSRSDRTLDVFLDDRKVSNIERVEGLTQDLRNDTFYVLLDERGLPASVYYKYLSESEKSYFAPVADLRLRSIEQSVSSGTLIEVDGSSLRVLTLDITGKKISNEDLLYSLRLSGLESIECRIFWEET